MSSCRREPAVLVGAWSAVRRASPREPGRACATLASFLYGRRGQTGADRARPRESQESGPVRLAEGTVRPFPRFSRKAPPPSLDAHGRVPGGRSRAPEPQSPRRELGCGNNGSRGCEVRTGPYRGARGTAASRAAPSQPAGRPLLRALGGLWGLALRLSGPLTPFPGALLFE